MRHYNSLLLVIHLGKTNTFSQLPLQVLLLEAKIEISLTDGSKKMPAPLQNVVANFSKNGKKCQAADILVKFIKNKSFLILMIYQ